MVFSGKTFVVTGAASGMGEAIASQLAEAGANLLLLDIKPLQILPKGSGDIVFKNGDLTDWNFVKDAVSNLNSLDGLVNVAGILLFGKDVGVENTDLEIWDKVMSVNLKSIVHTCKAALPVMRKSGGGAIVNFSTIQCLRGDSKPQDAYQASKAGVIALTKSIAIQHAHENIRANSILPGPTNSPMQERWREDPSLEKKTAQYIPLGRVGNVDDMANACLFLLSDKASFITGTELIVDGGVTALP